MQLFLLLDLILTLARGVRTKKQLYTEIAEQQQVKVDRNRHMFSGDQTKYLIIFC